MSQADRLCVEVESTAGAPANGLPPDPSVSASPKYAVVLVERPSPGAALRRAVDVLVVLASGPIVGPLILVLALAIKLDSRGPAFWLDERAGWGGRRFRLFKLRTMTVDAHQRRGEMLGQSVLPWPDFKIPNDPRITRLGRMLRKTSLDELPQLWNVLRGDITLVGPRASFVSVENYELWQTERLEVKPGLFGRWQAEGRARVGFEERCRMDIRQIRDQGLMADIALTVKSLISVVRQRGAV
jgi:lipopolysaccharide/colanic/teichoic acid biosynthesis glycosyltransferase